MTDSGYVIIEVRTCVCVYHMCSHVCMYVVAAMVRAASGVHQLLTCMNSCHQLCLCRAQLVSKAGPRYEVVFSNGVVVRTAADAENSDAVRLAACGEVLEGSGQIENIGGVERIQIEDGWVSLTLPPKKDGKPGETLLKRLS